MASMHRPVWTLDLDDVYQSLDSDPQGLTELEAQRRLERYGPNELPEPAHRPLWLRFTDQLTHFMALLLWVAGILAFVSQTPALGWAIWAVIWINAVFSFSQEFRAEQALAALKNVLPAQVRVFRQGKLVQIPARDLVRGDVMQLEEGDRISADARLVSEDLQQRYSRQREIPFDSRRRMMTVVLDWQADLWPDTFPQATQATQVAFTKGAPLEVVRHCQSILRNGTAGKLGHDDWEQVVAANDSFARQGFRVLGLDTRPGGDELRDMKAQDLEQGLTFVGLVAMFDPPRPEVPEAIAQCHRAGIRVTMVTGDYGLTAEAIAQQIGLLDDSHPSHEPVRVITGETLGHLSDAQLQQMVKYRSRLVFARMSPEHKLRLVEAYKATGAVVVVTGDGVNDAPALRSAHIGIAMGLNGTDVAREAADIVLTDDNFATIISAIEEGRTIYQNIRKFITYILASNVPELLPFLSMVAFKIPPARWVTG